MPNYCVNKTGDHEVHKMSCSYLPYPYNRIEFEALNDHEAMRIARERYYNDADGCDKCLPLYHTR